MSTTRVSYACKSDVPKSTQGQIQQLHEHETRIVELEVELSQLRKAHAELEHDLAPYRVEAPFTDIKSTQRIPLGLCQVEAAPIHRCPDEILRLFFEAFVLDPDEYFETSYYHSHIRRLPFVSVSRRRRNSALSPVNDTMVHLKHYIDSYEVPNTHHVHF